MNKLGRNKIYDKKLSKDWQFHSFFRSKLSQAKVKLYFMTIRETGTDTSRF